MKRVVGVSTAEYTKIILTLKRVEGKATELSNALVNFLEKQDKKTLMVAEYVVEDMILDSDLIAVGLKEIQKGLSNSGDKLYNEEGEE